LTYVSAIIIGVIAVEILLRLSIITSARDVLAASQNSLRVIRSTVMNDEQKQQFLLQYSWRSFSNTCMLALQLIILAIGVAGTFWLLTKLFSLENTLIYETSFLIFTTITSIVYAILRNRYV
jgi:hypothetical protein